MGKARFGGDFKQDTVHSLSGSDLLASHEKKITVQGYLVREVSQRLGVSIHSLYIWMKKFSGPTVSEPDTEQASEIRKLKRELAWVTEERIY